MARKKHTSPGPSGSQPNRQLRIRSSNVNEENVEEPQIDRLSDLPESILSNILSRLPTKDAVRTSILAKKWEYKWACIYNVEFNDRQFYANRRVRKERFSAFVDRVLMHGDGSSIQNFILRCSSNYESSRLHGWISAALKRNVQMLEIDIWSAQLVLPRFIYDNTSLQELRLLSQVTLRVPNDSLFSRLKRIDFNHVILRNQDLTTDQVMINFPCLEYLAMYCCKWRNVRMVKLVAPMLNTFQTTYASYQYRNRMEGFVFEVFASKLADFKLNGELLETYVLQTPASVETTTIRLFYTSEWISSGTRVAKTLRQMYALKTLELSGEVLIALNHAAEISTLPVFGCLTQLKLYTTYFSLTDGVAVIRLLHRAPVLQKLIMDVTTTLDKEFMYEGSNAIPPCFSSHLKVVKFQYAFDSVRKVEDLCLMKFILRNAMVLEKLYVVSPTSNRYFPVPSLAIRQHLLSFPRASSAASVLFS